MQTVFEVFRNKSKAAATYAQTDLIRSHENITCNAPSASQVMKRMDYFDAEAAIEAAEAGHAVTINFC